MEPPKKILVVGEKLTGKSSIIQIFKDYDPSTNSFTQSTANHSSTMFMSSPQFVPNNHSNNVPNTTRNKDQNNQKKQNPQLPGLGANADFSLKILRIDGKKVRVQLWDQGSNMNASTTFQPLYTRHVSGCIVVANTSNPKSLERAHRWKREFDKKTSIPNEPSIPATIFINHDIIQRQNNQNADQQINEGNQEEGNQGKLGPVNQFNEVQDDDEISPNKASEHDDDSPRESPEFQPLVARSPQRDQTALDQQKERKLPVHADQLAMMSFSTTGSQRWFHNTVVEYEKQAHYEKSAHVDSSGFFGVYHVSLGQPETISESFESFLSRLIEDQTKNARHDTCDSRFFNDYSLRSKKCLCRGINDVYQDPSQDNEDSFLGNKKDISVKNQRHHPQCPRAHTKNNGFGGGFYNSSEDNSFVLGRLQQRRFPNNRQMFQLPPNQQNNSCC